MKDNFSQQSGAYAKFRPAYPPELYDVIYNEITSFERAWDCGTGNGQVAGELADHFQEVLATDISREQLDKAVQKENIHYLVQSAEKSEFPARHFDLITVGQAIHWFNHELFYEKVRHCIRPEGVLAAFGYQLLRMDESVNRVIDHFYHDIVGPFWDAERRHIDDAYARIPFPFHRIPTPDMYMQYEWTLPQTLGYLTTWSAVQHYQREKQVDPVELIRPALEEAWGADSTKMASFRIILRLGRL